MFGFIGTRAALAFALLLAIAVSPCPPGSLSAAEPEVLVILWFDTEDYLLPADDDASKRLAEMLTARSIRATFKMVGEKARVLERRGRNDVIAALKRHDIGYHSNYHSVHPTPAEYLADCGLWDGVAEFARREAGGADDVRRIFGRKTLSCYGQPGSSWGPQTYVALSRIGIAPHGVPCYVDEGTHVGLDHRPFWYCGVLTVYHMGHNQGYTRMDLHDDGGFEVGCKAFQKMHERMRGEGGGLISIFYHPCEWVHREFWDGVNFRRGANPPREQWKPPPQRPPEESEAAYERFGRYVDYQKSLPGVRFVTAGDLPAIYRDRARKDGLARDVLEALVREVAGSDAVDIRRLRGGGHASAADQLSAVVELLAGLIESKTVPERLELPEVLGPSEPAPATEVDELSWLSFRDALLDVRDEIGARRQVPSRVYAGVRKIAPADFLLAAARAAAEALPPAGAGDPRFPARVKIPRGTRLEFERRVAEDTPGIFGGWVIHPEGFRAPRILEQARLQAWTLKPAER